MCQYDLAARNCPVACGTYKECFKSHPEDLNVHLVWDRIRRIVPKSSNNGTLCFGGGDGGAAAASEAVQRCRERQLNASLDDEMWEWRESFLSREGVRVDLDDCDEIAASFSAGCAFDLDPVRKFTQEVRVHLPCYIRPRWTCDVTYQAARKQSFAVLSTSFPVEWVVASTRAVAGYVTYHSTQSIINLRFLRLGRSFR